MPKNYLYKFRMNIAFLFLIVTTITSYAAEVIDRIELSRVRITMKLVEDDKIIDSYQSEFITKTGVNGNTVNWKTFKGNLNTTKKKGIASEVAAKSLFENLGYQILEDHYHNRINKLNANIEDKSGIFKNEQCTTKKGPDNGIDGIFILKDETIQKHSHIVINEAKYRSNQVNLTVNNFGFVAGGIQQSHSNWNRPRFSWASCLPKLNYDNETIIRTATLLDRDGTVKLYEVRDKDNTGKVIGEYASEAQKAWNIRKSYDNHIAPKLK